ncbi:hypothetical protein BV22DRAFT_1133780 [Leucogyrophana mollusca]|uniref:Uncharacterized protein n=1 Tax=Leucogyrophana mollusca TaxID=85980 RepID=A0ACB8B1F9_9AGAM|nr:hypothetical protein BV22DRAFT_1133780 [Leucogyrophana mollusca]
MDSDNVSQQTNALAGPSKITQDDAPVVFLPQPPAHPPIHTHLASTQDLLDRFHLIPFYDKYVRTPPPASLPDDKGKARATSPNPDDLDGEKKKKNSYRHLIKDVPGKHSMKKDDYLATMIQVPPKQRIPIVPFDSRTQREAFTLSAEGLKGWNTSALIVESAQAREDRRKRKELKKLARAQAQGSDPQQPNPSPATLPQQQPQLSQLSRPRVPAVQIPQPTRAGATPTPTSATTPSFPRNGTPMTSPPKTATTVGGVPPRTGASTPVVARGKKRDHEGADIVPTQPPLSVNGATSAGVIGAKAGSGGVRPRPIKKQRMDMQGQAREMPVQQPTPQGA